MVCTFEAMQPHSLQSEHSLVPRCSQMYLGTRLGDLRNNITGRQLPCLLTGSGEAVVQVSGGEVESDHLLHLSEGNKQL